MDIALNVLMISKAGLKESSFYFLLPFGHVGLFHINLAIHNIFFEAIKQRILYFSSQTILASNLVLRQIHDYAQYQFHKHRTASDKIQTMTACQHCASQSQKRMLHLSLTSNPFIFKIIDILHPHPIRAQENRNFVTTTKRNLQQTCAISISNTTSTLVVKRFWEYSSLIYAIHISVLPTKSSRTAGKCFALMLTILNIQRQYLFARLQQTTY